MNIQKIQNNTSFKSWQREVYKKTSQTNLIKEIKHRNDTAFYRGNFNYNRFPEFAEEFFKDAEKINTYFYGCSDGEDAYSYMMSMFTQLGDRAFKFLPIMAFDYDKFAIEKAKNDFLYISDAEKAEINYYTKNKLDTFLQKEDNNLYKPKKILSDNIIFKYGDITKDYKKIKSNNTILAARNFWPYLDIKTRNTLAKNLYDYMGEKSLLVVGEYDLQEWDIYLNSLLYKNGWEATDLDYVYKKGTPHSNIRIF